MSAKVRAERSLLVAPAMRLTAILSCLCSLANADPPPGLGKEVSGAVLNSVGSGLVSASIGIAINYAETADRCGASCRDVPPTLSAMALGISGGLVLLIGVPLELWGASQRRAAQGKKAWISVR